MKHVLDRRGMVETITIAIAAAMLAIASYLIPLLILLIPLLPVPFTIVSAKHGIYAGIIALMISTLIVGVVGGLFLALLYIISVGIVALGMGYLIRKGYSAFRVILLGTVISSLIIFGTLSLLIDEAGNTGADLIAEVLIATMQGQQEVLQSVGLSVNNIESMVHSFMVIFPGVIILQSLVSAIINYFISGGILRKKGVYIPGLVEFSGFKLPENIALGSVILLGLSYLTKYFEGIHTNALMANVLLLFIFLYYLQGLAYISFLLKKLKLSGGFRVGIMILLILATPLVMVIGVLGMLDTIFDLRRLRKG